MRTTARIEIAKAADAASYDEAALLMRHYVDWCRERYAALPWLVDAAFSYQGLEAELASLSSAYQQPAGLLLLARVDDEPAGCVAFRTIGDRICEMKRLFVESRFHGMGLGRHLCTALIEAAASRGFTVMRLDTGDLLTEAQTLYRALGFSEIPPFYDCPPQIRKHLVFMERRLP